MKARSILRSAILLGTALLTGGCFSGKSTEEIPADMKEMAEEYHTAMIEHIAEVDDNIMEKYLEGETDFSITCVTHCA